MSGSKPPSTPHSKRKLAEAFTPVKYTPTKEAEYEQTQANADSVYAKASDELGAAYARATLSANKDPAKLEHLVFKTTQMSTVLVNEHKLDTSVLKVEFEEPDTPSKPKKRQNTGKAKNDDVEGADDDPAAVSKQNTLPTRLREARDSSPAREDSTSTTKKTVKYDNKPDAGNSKENPFYVGRDGSAKIEKVLWHLTGQLSPRAIAAVQNQMVRFIQKKVVYVRGKNSVAQHSTLFPYVANAYVNLLTYRIMYKAGIKRLNEILAAYTEIKAKKTTNATQATRALQTSYEEDRPLSDRQFRRGLGEIHLLEAESGTYKSFRLLNSRYDVAKGFNTSLELLESLPPRHQHHPGPKKPSAGSKYFLRNYLRDQGFTTKKGTGWASVLRKWYQKDLEVTPKELDSILESTTPIVTICDALGGPGILLLLPAGIASQVNKWTTIMLDDILKEFVKLCPQVVEYGQVLTARIYNPLISGQGHLFKDCQIDVSEEGDPIMKRITDIFPQPESDGENDGESDVDDDSESEIDGESDVDGDDDET